MKQWILTMIVLMVSSLALAGTKKPTTSFKTEDFNQMIQESQKSEAQLRTQLQEKAGIRLETEKAGTLAREKYEAPQEAEQIVVSSSTPIWKEKKSREGRAQDRADMKRISQELQDASR